VRKPSGKKVWRLKDNAVVVDVVVVKKNE